ATAIAFIVLAVLGMVGVVFKLIPWLIVIAIGVWFFKNHVYSPR
ncbi:envelope stress response protein PspG, partial [Vibrio genomosp. F10]